MRHPTSGFHKLGEGSAVLALEEGQDRGLLAVVARCGGFPLGSLGRFRLRGSLGLPTLLCGCLGLVGALRGVAVSAGLPPSRLWIAFQILLTANFWFANFLTGVRPGMPFQTSISRSAGHSATRLASSCWLLKLSPSPASCLVACAVMLFSLSLVYVFISLFL